MSGHGNHWETLYSIEEYLKSRLRRDVQESKLICKADCIDVVNGTDRTETVNCLRWGDTHLANQVLVVSDSAQQSNVFFSAYPVVLDGVKRDVVIDSVEPWEHGIESLVSVTLGETGPTVHFFDTMYFKDTAELQAGVTATYNFAGLAYWLRPIQRRSFEVSEGAFWERERDRRLAEGEAPETADRPVEIHLTGAAIFLQPDSEAKDDAQFQAMIDKVDVITHDGQTVYRLEMTVMRPDEGDFSIPVYAAERVLDGYIPRLGDDVEGVMWAQGKKWLGLSEQIHPDR